jgi:hypothetical protein
MHTLQKGILCVVCFCNILISLITITGRVKNTDGEVTILMRNTIFDRIQKGWEGGFKKPQIKASL